MALVASASDALEAFRCAVCLEVMADPTLATPCGHAFCCACISTAGAALQAETKAGTGCPEQMALPCPLCRSPVQSFEPHNELQDRMRETVSQCPPCGATVRVSDLREHQATCEKVREMEAEAAQKLMLRSDSKHVNRSTFICPFPSCNASNLDNNGLISHFDNAHPLESCAAVCPVCVSMPWGDSSYICNDVVGHIKLRHKYEYDEYVDYNGDEDAILQAALAASMEDK